MLASRRFPVALVVALSLAFTVGLGPAAADEGATPPAEMEGAEAPAVLCEAASAPAEIQLIVPGPIGGNCPTNRCTVDNDCGDECTVTGCAWPCGACVYETSDACSGYCFCR